MSPGDAPRPVEFIDGGAGVTRATRAVMMCSGFDGGGEAVEGAEEAGEAPPAGTLRARVRRETCLARGRSLDENILGLGHGL